MGICREMWLADNVLRHFVRLPGFRRLWQRFPFGSVALRTEFDIWNRPHYAYGICAASRLARSLKLPGISVIEFGVAGGNGLVSMERIAKQVADCFQIQITVYGFDTGTGMPATTDYRDLPHVWGAGFYKMDVDKLKARLDGAELLLGDVSCTIPTFLAKPPAHPVGFVAFDLDYYSSTKAALSLLGGAVSTHLPRVYCYFDDVVWPEHACHNEYTGELCAIREFNEAHDAQKIARIANFHWTRRRPARWNDQMYVCHDFGHPLYSQLVTPDGDYYRQNELR